MKDIKDVIAENLTTLRKQSKLTQAELAEHFSYSDKTVSKWESGESLPSIDVLKNLADFYSTTLNDLTSEGSYENRKSNTDPKQRGNKLAISLLSVSVVWFLATVIYVENYLMSGKLIWMAFIWAIPASLVVGLVFNSIWGSRKMQYTIISLLVWTLLGAVYLENLQYNQWIIFILGIPAQIVVILWSTLKTRGNVTEHKKSHRERRKEKKEAQQNSQQSAD